MGRRSRALAIGVAVAVGLFTPAERLAFAPREKLAPTTWAERNRVLPEWVAEPGPYRFDRTPFWREVIDLLQDRTVEEIIILKSCQVGYSTTLQNMIGWMVDQSPGPCLMVMPNGDLVNKLVNENIKPLIQTSRTLQEHNPHVTKIRAEFDSMNVYFAKAGSASALSSREIRYLLLDEADKFPLRAGQDSDPISLAIARTTTFRHNRKIVMGSTPTTKERHIYKWYESASDKRHYEVPCPHCGEYHRLLFPNLKWQIPEEITERRDQAEYLLNNPAAVQAVCPHCGGLFSNEQKNAAMGQGHWVSVGQTGSKRVAFQISALYSPWMSFAQIAAEFLRCLGDPMKMMRFRNEVLGEFWEEVAEKLDSTELERAASTAPPQWEVPHWTGYLIASADCHGEKIGLRYTLRAWGYGERSQLVSAGKVANFEDLRKILLDPSFAVKGRDQRIWVDSLYIDAGFRTNEVYAFSQSDDRIKPVKGASVPSYLISRTKPKEYPGVTLRLIDTGFFKSKLAQLRKAGLAMWGICQLPEKIHKQYLREISAEHQVRKKGKLVWQTISEGLANHFGDCEVYSVAGAIADLHIEQLPPPEPEPEPTPAAATPIPAAAVPAPPPAAAPPAVPTNTPNPWLKGTWGKPRYR